MSLRDLKRPASFDNKTIVLFTISTVICLSLMIFLARLFFSSGEAIGASNNNGVMVDREEQPGLAWFVFLFMECALGFYLLFPVWAFWREAKKE